MEALRVATGHILVMEGKYGKLECLSLGDYGRQHNVKADFLGKDYQRDLAQVEHAVMLPLEDKWVITISTQYGCSMGCTFCDVPKVGPGRNATVEDMLSQVHTCMELHPEVTKGRINLHFARMGEPTWNPHVLAASRYLRSELQENFQFHPVVSTMMPRYNKKLKEFISEWMFAKQAANGDAGLQVSVNSTCEKQRNKMFNGNAHTLQDISSLFLSILHQHPVVGRKIALNFAVTDDYEIDAVELSKLFNPKHFMCKLTPMHVTSAAMNNGLSTPGNALSTAAYKHHEKALKDVGFDVLVFVASRAEDEGRITCGNAILSGTRPYGQGLLS